MQTNWKNSSLVRELFWFLFYFSIAYSVGKRQEVRGFLTSRLLTYVLPVLAFGEKVLAVVLQAEISELYYLPECMPREA